MNAQDLEEFVSSHEDFLRKCWADNKSIKPMLIIFGPGPFVPILFSHFEEREKVLVRKIFKTMALTPGTQKLVLISEVWMSPTFASAKEAYDFQRANKSISDSAEKREGILVNAASRTGDIVGIWRIIRDDGPPRIGERLSMPRTMSRFTQDLVWAPE